MTSENPQVTPDDLAAVQHCKEAYDRIRKELAEVIVGQSDVIEQVLIAIFARGHALLEGVPGLAKTLLVSSLAEATHLGFKRIQFTPDLMPSDVTGTQIIQEDSETRRRQYQFLPGPLFANMILADEINRTPPKTQAAMLEAMQERQISSGGQVHMLPDPFFVLATQNPLEQEGTYPLPEAQLDRFLLYIKVGYPKATEEWDIARRVTTGKQGTIAPSLSGEDIVRLQKLVLRVPVSDQVLGYAWALVRATASGHAGSRRFRQQVGFLGRRAARCADADHAAPRPGRSSTAGITPRWATFNGWSSRPCGIALPPITRPRPVISTATA